MIKAKVVQMALEKMLKSPITQDARFQVKAGDKYYDVMSMKLLENQVIGSRETHRIVIEVQDREFAPMGKILNSKGEVM
jgi:hypothetical protein|tara:strand:+ start:97 stop:333 length:237 start_codon:yes stop_codon:yes gene_type:complete